MSQSLQTRVFVTGGSGLLGNNIVRCLLANGHSVRALVRPGSENSFKDLGVELIQGDLSDPSILNEAMQDCCAVIHSAAMIHIGWERLGSSRAVNVQGTKNIVQACQTTGCKLLHVSTVDTLPAADSLDAPINEQMALSGDLVRFENVESRKRKTPCSYVVSKLESEQVVVNALKKQLVEATIVHPGFMLGPYDWKPSSGQMMLGVHRAPIVAAPRGGCSVCDARDVADAIVYATMNATKNRRYILAGENISYQELWRAILQTSGRQKKVFRMGPGIIAVGKLIDTLNRWTPLTEGVLNGAAIAMGNLIHAYDSQLAVEELGYTRRPLSQTLQDAWSWLSDNHSM